MHFYCMTRGIKNRVDEFINDCQGKSFPYPGGQPGEYVQLSLRPLQMWEVVFPKDALQDVIKIFEPQNKFFENQSWVNKYTFLMRKLLKLREAPEWDSKSLKSPMNLVRKKDVHVVGIGIRDDVDNPKTGREML